MTVLAAVLIVVTVFGLGLAATQPPWRRDRAEPEPGGITEQQARQLLYPDGNVELLSPHKEKD